MIDFYTKILESLGFTIDEESVVHIGNKVKKLNKLPLVLPVPDKVEQLTEWDDETKSYKDKYTLFHPLKENLIRDNPSLLDLKRAMEIKLNNSCTVIFRLLANAIKNNVQDLPLDIQKTLSDIKVSKRVKNKIDDKFDNFLLENSINMISGEIQVFKLHVPRGIKYKGGKVNRALTIESPMLNIINSEEDFKHTYRLNDKHVSILRTFCEFVLGGWKDNTVVTFSNNNKVAGPIVILEGFSEINKHINNILDNLEDLDMELVENTKINITYDVDVIETLKDIDYYIPEVGDVKSNGKQIEVYEETNEPTVDVDDLINDDVVRYRRPQAAIRINQDQEYNDRYGVREDVHQQQNTYTPNGSRVAVNINDGYSNQQYQQQNYNQGYHQQGYNQQGYNNGAGREIDYLTSLIQNGAQMDPPTRDWYYERLNPRERDEYHYVMENPRRDNSMHQHLQPDRR